MLRKLLVILLLISFCLAKAKAQDSLLFRQVLSHGLSDGKAYVTAPLSWQKKDWLLFSGLTATTGAMILWGDQAVYDFSNTLHTSGLDHFSENIEPLGNNFAYMAIGAIALKGLIQKDNYALETGFIALESYLFGAVFVRTSKMLAGRVRPNSQGTSNPHLWDGPFIEDPFFRQTSFFSGHTTTVFSIASVFAYRYRDIKWVPYLSYGLATLGGLERIYNNRHWTSDVIVAAAVGTATGIFLSKQWEEKPIRFYPLAGDVNGIGMVVQF